MKRWINDYLDLLNYAGQIGHAVWKDDIIRCLKQMIIPDYNPAEEWKAVLWQQYGRSRFSERWNHLL